MSHFPTSTAIRFPEPVGQKDPLREVAAYSQSGEAPNAPAVVSHNPLQYGWCSALATRAVMNRHTACC